MIKGAIAGLFLGIAASAVSHSTETEERATGLIPLSQEEFAKLPKTPTYRAFLPERVDLSANFPPPGDQGNAGSCTAWAVGYAARAYYASSVEGRNIRSATNIPSPGYIFGSVISQPGNCNSGSRTVDALNLLKNGALSLKAFPYHSGQCPQPSDQQRATAIDFRIRDWLAIDFGSIDQLKGELAKGHPVIIGISMRKSLETLPRGQVYHSHPDEPVIGSHALTAIGYDERLQAFRVINSWGTRWADGGFAWFGYDAFRNDVREAYVMRPNQPLVPEPSPTPLPTPVLNPPAPQPAPIAVKPPIPLTGIECGHVLEVKRDGKLVFNGFVGSDNDLAKLTDQAKAARADIEVAVRPWPQCEALLTLDKPLAQQDRLAVKIETAGRLTEKNSEAGGAAESNEYLKFAITTPPYPSFLHAAYIQADGSVVNVMQPDDMKLAAFAPSTKVILGDINGLGPKFKVSAPYGREMLVVLAGRSPIFPTLRPTQETEREFLTALRQALLAKPDRASADRTISAGFDVVVTSETSVISTQGVQQ
jgi:hypothetical protein